jgi:hypothetical protein
MEKEVIINQFPTFIRWLEQWEGQILHWRADVLLAQCKDSWHVRQATLAASPSVIVVRLFEMLKILWGQLLLLWSLHTSQSLFCWAKQNLGSKRGWSSGRCECCGSSSSSGPGFHIHLRRGSETKRNHTEGAHLPSVCVLGVGLLEMEWEPVNQARGSRGNKGNQENI